MDIMDILNIYYSQIKVCYMYVLPNLFFFFHNAIQKLPFQSEISTVITDRSYLVTEKSNSRFSNSKERYQ